MSDPEDVPAVIAAAEHAAATGDFAAAESLLRVALREQEAQLGVAHPDVASTLNNLAVVCEMASKFDEAGRFYQRASELTLAALGPSHPLTVTSRDNLHAFRQARGERSERLDAAPAPPRAPAEPTVETPGPPAVPSDTPSATPPAAPPVAPATRPQAPAHQASKRRARKGQVPKPAAPKSAAPGQQPPGVQAPQPQAPPRSTPTPEAAARPAAVPTRRGAGRGLAVAALVLAAAAIWWWSGRDDRAAVGNAPATSAEAPVVRDAAAAPPAAAGTAAPSAGVSTEPARPEARAATPAPATPSPAFPSASSAGSETAVGSAAGDVRVLEARICGTLTTGAGRWRCTPPANPVAPGRLSFYTRIASPRAIRVHHRWFRAGILQQDVDLSVGANPSAGFRTFSRQVIDAAPGTEWRVELRTSNGRLLQEERIIVR